MQPQTSTTTKRVKKLTNKARAALKDKVVTISSKTHTGDDHIHTKHLIKTTHKCHHVEVGDIENDLDNCDKPNTVINDNNKQTTTSAVTAETELIEELSPKEDLAKMMKEWNSPVYAFFQPIPTIEKVGKQYSHVFKCCARGCKVTIRRYLDTADARSIRNMRKHAKKCWGDETLKAADVAKGTTEVREKIVGSILRTGSIMQAFERKGQGKVTYSVRQHTCAETK